MSLPSPAVPRNLTVGNSAGFLLAFHKENDDGTVIEPGGWWLGSDDVHAEIHAALPGGLEGGSYRFTIERMPDDLYAKLVERDELARRLYRVVRLYLFWREALSGPGDYLTGLVGLAELGDLNPESVGNDPVATLSVVDVARANGDRGIETTITCREHVFNWLSRRTVCSGGAGGIDVSTLPTAVDTVLSRLGLINKSRTYPLTQAPAPSTAPGRDRQQIANRTPGVEAMQFLAGRMEHHTGKFGRGMLMLRKGTLHVGPRPIPLEGEAKDLTEANGLVDQQALEPLNTDPAFDRCANPTGEPLIRQQRKLVCKGRPDLRPGDVVRFSLPPEEAPPSGFFGSGLIGTVAALAAGPLLPTLGGITEPSMRMYVNSVEHRFGRRTGFVTTVTGIELIEGRPDWDTHTAPPRREEPEPSADAGTDTARAIQSVSRAVLSRIAQVDAGEVRAATTSGSGSDPAQTLLVWRGLAAGTGDANQAARLPVARPSPAPATGAPYLTPFAFGKAGLVLPNYPGMRVAVAHHLGDSADPIVAGALWTSGEAPDSQPGDWWLILPAEVTPAKRGSFTDTDEPTRYTGKATDDLTDADGNRVIEAGELTIRIGSAALDGAGTRPKRASQAPGAPGGLAQAVTIEHADGGSMIVMKADGTIQIKTGGDLEIQAANVRVKVSGTMDVSS